MVFGWFLMIFGWFSKEMGHCQGMKSMSYKKHHTNGYGEGCPFDGSQHGEFLLGHVADPCLGCLKRFSCQRELLTV